MKLAILTNVITPYRAILFNCLAGHPEINLAVILLSRRDNRHDWHPSDCLLNCKVITLPGITVWHGLQNYPLYLNPGVIRAIRQEAPDVLVCGGYDSPTFWVAIGYARYRQIRLVLWSESTKADRRNHAWLTALIKRKLGL